MGTTYTTTITIRCWKEHTCVGCQAKYAYLFARTVTGQAATADGSKAAAEANVMNTVKNQVDMHPCPTCGLYQPDMIGAQRSKRLWWVFGIAAVAFAVLLIMYAAGVSPATVCYTAAVVCGIAAVANAMIGLNNPNTNLEKNKALAQQTMQRNALQLGQAGTSEAPDPDALGGGNGGVWLAVALLGLAAILVLVPEGLRTVNGWPLNDDFSPPVIGPGDEAKIYFPQWISSVKGYWNGTATATAQVRGVSGAPISIMARTNQSTWSQNISVKSSEKDSSAHLWATLVVPPQADLANKKLQVTINLQISYPKADPGGKTFSILSGAYSHKVNLDTSPAKAGAQYTETWWYAMLAGIVLTLGATGFLIARANAQKGKAPPTAVYGAN